MNKKDATFIRKSVSNPETSVVAKIASCYVDVLHDEDIRVQPAAPFLAIPEDEVELYCGFLKKGLNAKPDSNAFLVKHSAEWLKPLLDSKLEDLDLLGNACAAIRDNYSSDENYSIIFAYGSYEGLPVSGTFPFLVVMIQPCAFDKPGIVYDYKDNAFGARKKERALGAPVQTFMYPAVSDLAADWEHVLCVSKTAKAVDDLRRFIEGLLGGKIDPSLDEQKALFNSIVESGFENGKASYACVQDVVDRVNELAVESSLGEDRTLTPKELAKTLIDSGYIEEDRAEFVREAAEEAGKVGFNPELIVDKNISIVTDSATIKVAKDDLDQIRVKVIDGEECYVIPARNATIAGIAVNG